MGRDFLELHRKSKFDFVPIGVAQGWSNESYSAAVVALQKMGYRKIAIGGLVPLKTADILAVMQAVSLVRKPTTEFHLLGVTRLEHSRRLRGWGVTSFDSTSPLRQAWMDDRDNYYAPSRTYVAVRVPQVDGNPRLKAQIFAGTVDGRRARVLERNALKALQSYDAGNAPLGSTVEAVMEYASLCKPDEDHRRTDYTETLGDMPWKDCGCDICNDIGINVVLFRGAERNRRRGFHNLHVFYNNLKRETRKRATHTVEVG